MIKFFRKIRQRLLTDNKFSKYLLYAIGEIILVVIGILIALQIGNLNEQRKKYEQGIIQEKALKIDLQNDLEILKLDLEYITKEIKINNAYAERLSNLTSNIDTLVKIVRYEYYGGLNTLKELNKTTFNSLESTGEIALFEKDLAKNVQEYYTERNTMIATSNNNMRIYYNLLEPFMSKYPGYWFIIQGHLQDSYWKNANKKTIYSEFNGLLTVRLFNMEVRKNIVERLIDKTEILIDKLD
ncbi:DUF6090 family protein [Flavisericum labens]|uniref:DUF6090 family protein n=1 Tax=Flavisericum labens TaxID=3377112 RepID=UPI00387B5959